MELLVPFDEVFLVGEISWMLEFTSLAGMESRMAGSGGNAVGVGLGVMVGRGVTGGNPTIGVLEIKM